MNPNPQIRTLKPQMSLWKYTSIKSSARLLFGACRGFYASFYARAVIISIDCSPMEDISFSGSSSLRGHVPWVILLKDRENQSHVQWLMCLTLHEMSLYSEAPITSFYQGCLVCTMYSCQPACLTDWLPACLPDCHNVACNEKHFIITALCSQNRDRRTDHVDQE